MFAVFKFSGGRFCMEQFSVDILRRRRAHCLHGNGKSFSSAYRRGARVCMFVIGAERVMWINGYSGGVEIRPCIRHLLYTITSVG